VAVYGLDERKTTILKEVDGVMIQSEFLMTKIEVYNSMGQKILDIPVRRGIQHYWIPTIAWSRGMYAIALYEGQKKRCIQWIHK